MRDEAIADLSSRSEGELRQSEECGAMREAAGGGDHQLPRVLAAEGRHHHSSFANRGASTSQLLCQEDAAIIID